MLLRRTLLLLLATSALSFANIPIVITDTDPNFGLAGDNVFGSPAVYAIQSFTLTGPSNGTTVGTWTLTIDTNYGVNPVGDTSMPDFCSGGGTFVGGAMPCSDGSIPYFMSDFLIQQGSQYWGIDLSTGHVDYGSPGFSDGSQAGDLYSGTGFKDDVQGAPTAGPVILNSTFNPSTKDGTGTLSVSLNHPSGGGTCYGGPHGTGIGYTDCALYQVTDTFTVSSASQFFDPTAMATFIASSADCYNAPLVLTTPEPSGLAWLVPGLLLGFAYLRRRSLVARAN